MRGEIGPRRRRAAVPPPETPAPQAVEPEAVFAPKRPARRAAAPQWQDLKARLREVAQLLGPGGLTVAGLLAVLIFGSMLINWLL